MLILIWILAVQDIISDLIEDQTKPNFRLDELEILFKRTNNDHYYGSSNKSAGVFEESHRQHDSDI